MLSRTVTFLREPLFWGHIFPYDKKMADAQRSESPPYGAVRSPREFGQLMRAHRKSRGWTLRQLAQFANLSMRFLSELERGKKTAELGKALHALQLLGLEIAIVPRQAFPRKFRRGFGIESEDAAE